MFPLKPESAASKRLDEFRDAGIGMVEIYAPAEAGNSFLGLDTIDRYKVDPRIARPIAVSNSPKRNATLVIRRRH